MKHTATIILRYTLLPSDVKRIVQLNCRYNTWIRHWTTAVVLRGERVLLVRIELQANNVATTGCKNTLRGIEFCDDRNMVGSNGKRPAPQRAGESLMCS